MNSDSGWPPPFCAAREATIQSRFIATLLKRHYERAGRRTPQPQEGAQNALKSMSFRYTEMVALIVTPIVLFSSESALAASIKNNDAGAAVITIVENGNRSEVVIESGASETLCPKGCFITLPNGDRIGLSGGESVEIVKGGAVVK